MAKIKLHISYLSPLFQDALALVQNNKYKLSFQDKMAANEDELAAPIRDAHALYLGGDDYYSENVLRQAKNLKLISFGGTGFDSYIDMQAATKLGIAVTNTPGANSKSVAKNQVWFINRAIRSILANGVYHPEPVKLGLIGFGNIHKNLYELLNENTSFQVHFWNRTKIDSPDYRDLDTILKESELLSISITANKETQGFLDAEKFAKMGGNKFGLINSCRHNLVDESALVEFLNRFWARSYYVDQQVNLKGVKEFPRNPYKVRMTDVIGCRTEEAWNKTDMMAFQNIIDFFETGTSTYIVNPEYKNFLKYKESKQKVKNLGAFENISKGKKTERGQKVK